ncbi:MAG: hypothetical protein ACK2UL_02625, partial [Anaerolineae bacterium]
MTLHEAPESWMGDNWVVYLPHWLDDDGEVPDFPGRPLALHMCAIVEGITSQAAGAVLPTGVKCRRRPGRKPCPGQILALREDSSDYITWMCLECRDRGTITGWQGTKWDKRAEADRPMPRAKLLSFEQETARLRQREAARERRPEVARGSQREAPRLRHQEAARLGQQRPSPLPSTPRRGASKVQWSGTVLGVQPRIKLLRSFDQRSHT